MKQYEGRVAGILGTLILHLIAAIIVMSVKLSSLYEENRSEFLIEFENEREMVTEDLVEVPMTLEQVFEGDERYLDIVRNIARTEVADIDPAEYQDRVKEELIKAGLLGEDNFIDQQKNEEADQGENNPEISTSTSENDSTDTHLTANEMASLYDGPTRIYYELGERYHLKLPIPIYKCRNAGKIIYNIIVDRSGRIIEKSINETLSETSDPCLVEAATRSVNQTRFNPDATAPEVQAGSITFTFVAQ